MKKTIFYLLLFIFSACSTPSEKDQWVNESDSIKYSKQREIEVWGHRLLGKHKERFYGTPVQKLAYAIAENNIRVVEKELLKLPDSLINFQEEKGAISLVDFAVLNANYDAMKLLIENGVDPNLTRRSGGNAFTAALSLKHSSLNKEIRFFDFLIENGGDPNSFDTGNSNTILMSASRHDVETVKRLIEIGADPHYCHYSEDSSQVVSPLNKAIMHVRIDIALYYLWECDVDPNSLTVFNKTTGTWTIADRVNDMHFRKDDTLSYQKKEQLLDTLRTMGFVSRQEQGYSIY